MAWSLAMRRCIGASVSSSMHNYGQPDDRDRRARNHPWHGGGTHLQRRRSRRDLRDRRCRRQRLARRHHDHRSRRPCPGPAMTQIGGVPDMHDEDDYPYDNPVSRAQAESLREQARAGGLRFEAYLPPEIGRASCRERVCQYVEISVVAVSLKKKKHTNKRHDKNEIKKREQHK